MHLEKKALISPLLKHKYLHTIFEQGDKINAHYESHPVTDFRQKSSKKYKTIKLSPCIF